MSTRKSKSQETNPENKPDTAKIELWKQIIITIGAIAVAAIGAWQAVLIARTPPVEEIPASVPTSASLNTVATTSIPMLVTPIQTIEFDYQDSPTNHGWEMSEGDPAQLDIEHTHDQFVGNAISITSPVKYGMDFEVGSAAAQRGSVVEFVANLTKDAVIYASVRLERDEASTQNGWIKLTTRRGPPTFVDEDEWQLSIISVSSKGGDWLLYQVDLQDAVRQTFGNDGWKFQQLNKFRIRGDLALDYINIFESQP